MSRQKSVRFNFIMNFILTASAFVFPLITYPYVSRVLMPEGIGKVTFADSVISYFIMVAMLGVPTYGIRACARVRDDKEKLSKTVQELMMLNLALAAVCYVVLGISLCFVEKFQQEKTILLISSTGILLNAIGVNWFYSAIEEYAYITIRSLVFKVLAVGFMFAFIHSPEDYKLYAVMTLLTSSGSYIMNFIRLRKYITFRRFPQYEFRPHVKVVLVFFAMAVATTIYTNLDTVMLGFLSGDTEVGYYNTAIKVKQILVTLVTSLGTVLLPRLSYYIEKGDKAAFSRIVAKAMHFVLLAAVPLVIAFILFAKPVILILSGDAFLPSITPMRIIMPTVLLIGLTNIMGMQIMVPTGREKQVVISVAAGGFVDLIINFALIPSFGASGAAVGTLVAELVVLLVQAGLLREELKKIPPIAVWKILLAAVLAGAASAAIDARINIPILLLDLAVSGCVFGAVYAAVLLVTRDTLLREEILTKIIKKG